MKKSINILVSFIATIIFSLLYLPVKISGGFAGVPSHNARTNINSLIISNDTKCADCFQYDIRWGMLIIQSVLLFAIILILLNTIPKLLKGGKNNE